MRRFAAVLAVLLAGPAAAYVAAAEPAVRVTKVGIDHSAFDPGSFEFEAGERVRFVIHNHDPIDHEFILGDEEVQARHESGSEPDHGAIPGEVSIDAGETRTTTYVFDESGTLIIGCHLPGHYDYGMRAEVTVEAT
jgi:uncharacterized cupredoxin-like copper-binding protein